MTLWDVSARQLLDATASDAPTPGGGSIACVSGALGVALVSMAIAVTRKSAPSPELDALAAELAAHRAALELGATDDVAAFEDYMAALAMSRATDADKAARAAALASAAERAVAPPLGAAERLVAALDCASRAAPLAKKTILSDVLAGADLARGAANAALRSVDINVPALAEPLKTEVAAARAVLAQAIEDGYARVLAFR